MSRVKSENLANPACEPAFMDSKALSSHRYPCDWLIQGVLVRGQPCVLGGAMKAMKTSVALDLAVSLGSGKPFLGSFPAARARVAYVSGEAAPATIQETAMRICAARGVRLESSNVLWSFRPPYLDQASALVEFGEQLQEHDVTVVIIDPLYVCLLPTGQGADALNLFAVGPLLHRVGQTCLAAGATPLLVHHARKGADRGDPLDVDDLAYAGVGEYVRQWIMLSRREQYKHGTGEHHMRMTVGGTAGQSGDWDLDISEGRLTSRSMRRQWDVQVRSADESQVRRRRARPGEYNLSRH